LTAAGTAHRRERVAEWSRDAQDAREREEPDPPVSPARTTSRSAGFMIAAIVVAVVVGLLVLAYYFPQTGE
jgi:hypothetical protein